MHLSVFLGGGREGEPSELHSQCWQGWGRGQGVQQRSQYAPGTAACQHTAGRQEPGRNEKNLHWPCQEDRHRIAGWFPPSLLVLQHLLLGPVQDPTTWGFPQVVEAQLRWILKDSYTAVYVQKIYVWSPKVSRSPFCLVDSSTLRHTLIADTSD